MRATKRQLAARRSRIRIGVALALTLLAHAVAIPLFVLSFQLQPSLATKEPEVALVRVPAAAWDAARGELPAPARRTPQPPAPAPAPEKEPERTPEKPPAQVVDTAPGNDQKAKDARFAAESANRVEKETISRERRAGAGVTMPRETTSVRPPTQPPAPGARQESIALGEASEEPVKPEGLGAHLELPSLVRREQLALQLDRNGAGTVHNREASEELKGNSDKLRVQVGAGEGDAAPARPLGAPSGNPALARLFPSAATLDRLTGAPAPDHVTGIEEGDATFLNTKEWRYASFFNRVKASIANEWQPGGALRRRDPTGEMYGWKDRYTILQVTLRENGELADVFVQESCGVEFLDREAIAAFHKAQPFPNPPRGLADASGEISFTFGFFLETSRASLRLFRNR